MVIVVVTSVAVPVAEGVLVVVVVVVLVVVVVAGVAGVVVVVAAVATDRILSVSQICTSRRLSKIPMTAH